jgi:hypothetical protein
MIDSFNNLLIEKYRPKTLDDIVLSKDDREFFETLSTKQEIPHLLFTGSPGVGKSTTAKVIVNDMLGCQYQYINSSDENNVDTVRTRISGFSKTKSIDGNFKVVILDECLEENTLVTVLRDGTEQQIPIKDVDESNDLVKTFNFSKDRIEWRPFYKINKGTQEVYEVEFENGETVICTSDHKWYVKDNNSDIPIRKKLIDIIAEEITEIVSIS